LKQAHSLMRDVEVVIEILLSSIVLISVIRSMNITCQPFLILSCLVSTRIKSVRKSESPLVTFSRREYPVTIYPLMNSQKPINRR
jgi:hypothetical protein